MMPLEFGGEEPSRTDSRVGYSSHASRAGSVAVRRVRVEDLGVGGEGEFGAGVVRVDAGGVGGEKARRGLVGDGAGDGDGDRSVSERV